MKKIRNTYAKSHIQELIRASGKALSPADVQHLSEGVCDRVTIYRVLERLVSEGLVHKTTNLEGVVRYASCAACDDEDNHHHGHVHFNCEVCNEVTCLVNVVPEFKVPNKYKVNEVNFTLSGTCPKCV